MLIEGLSFAAYEVQRRTAVGGMGEVYLCQHRALNRVDAVKVLRPHLAHDPRFRRRFLREALSAARMRHPNVLTVYTADEADGLLYLAMEYVEGEDLASLLARCGPLPVVRTVSLLRVAAEALDAAHRSRLVHRDIKPSNLLVVAIDQPLESVTLVGFGVSRLFDEERESPGEILDAVAYASPEQLARHLVTGACDQYSLACVAFECLTGSIPFPGSTQAEVVTAHLQSPPPSASALVPSLPPAVDAVFARALAKEPTERYASCGALVEALGQALGVAPALTTLLPALVPSGELTALMPRAPSGGFPAVPAAFAEPTALLVQIPRRSTGAGADLTAVLPRAVPDDDPDFPNPDSLLTAVESSADPGRGAGDLAVRLGLADPPAVGPALLRLAAGPIALRAEPEAAVGPLRWLLAQVATRYTVGQLCLAAALAPAEDETWLWVNWLGVSRPSTPPLTGSHVATTPVAARDLVARLRTVVAARQAGLGPESDWEPQVLALLDTRLFDRPAVTPAEWDAAASVGVHVVYFCAPGETAAQSATTVDVADARFVVAAESLRIEGTVDQVDGAYVRRLAEILPER